MPAYRDDPAALNSYYNTVPRAHDPAHPPNDIPLISSPTSAGAFQAYHPTATDSTVDFADRHNTNTKQEYDDSSEELAPEGSKYGFSDTRTATDGGFLNTRIATDGSFLNTRIATDGSFSNTRTPNDGSAVWTTGNASRTRRSKTMMIGGGLVLIAVVVVAVVVGVVVSKNNGKNSKTLSNSGSSGGGSSSNSNSSVTQSNPDDPSSFVKNPNLHQSFYGMAYTPAGSQLPDCGNSLSEVIQDIQLMSQLTTRIRLYGADCNQSALVLEAIKKTKVNMSVWLGNTPVAVDNGTTYKRQRDLIQSAIQTYGTEHIAGVTVGNEFMLNYVINNGVTDPNSAVGNQGAAILIADIKDTRSMLSAMNLTNMLVGTSDASGYFNTQVLQAVDYGMANVHPWFGNVNIDGAASWTTDLFWQQDVPQAQALSNNPKMYIAETGWPTKSSDAASASDGSSLASEANLQIFLDTFVCQANSNGTGYFYFEFYDETWKDVTFGGVEGWWGLFTANRTLKNIEIPNCQST